MNRILFRAGPRKGSSKNVWFGAVRTLAIGAVALMVMASECGDTVDALAGPGATKNIAIKLINGDDLAVHLFVDSETFPCCQVQPQASRTVNRTMATFDGVSITAGRNGEILTRTACVVSVNSGGAFETGTASVVYSSAGLACSGW